MRKHSPGNFMMEKCNNLELAYMKKEVSFLYSIIFYVCSYFEIFNMQLLLKIKKMALQKLA